MKILIFLLIVVFGSIGVESCVEVNQSCTTDLDCCGFFTVCRSDVCLELSNQQSTVSETSATAAEINTPLPTQIDNALIASHPNLKLLPRYPNCGKTSTSVTGRKRSLGGSLTNPNEYPWLVQIYSKNVSSEETYFEGAGTLINSRYVLTSTDVIPVARVLSHVMIGEAGFKRWILKNMISEVIAHDGAAVSLGRHKILLMRLTEAVINPHPICLPIEKTKRNFTGADIKSAGWGASAFGVQVSNPNTAHKVPMKIVPNEFCDRVHRAEIGRLDTYQFCAISKTIYGDSGICNGDLGNPLMLSEAVRPTAYKVTQIGIASYKSYCGLKGIPTIFANVTEYLPWILDNMKL